MLRTLLGLAAAVIALAGLYFARDLVGPLVLGAVLVIICHPLRRPLERRGWPRWLATTAVIVVAYVILAVLVLLLLYAGTQFVRLIGDYTDELRATSRTVRAIPGETAAHGPGDVYSLPAGVFHSTLLDAGPDAATVALGVESPIGRDLSLGGLDLRSHQVRRMRCEPAETARAARRAAALLAAEVAS
jgi:hypothetical protein